MQHRAASHVHARPEQSSRNNPEGQSEAQHTEAKGLTPMHARPELACIPGRKWLKRLPADTEIRSGVSQDTMPAVSFAPSQGHTHTHTHTYSRQSQADLISRLSLPAAVLCSKHSPADLISRLTLAVNKPRSSIMSQSCQLSMLPPVRAPCWKCSQAEFA